METISIIKSDGSFSVMGKLDVQDKKFISKFSGKIFCGKELIDGEWRDKDATRIIKNYLEHRNYKVIL